MLRFIGYIFSKVKESPSLHYSAFLASAVLNPSGIFLQLHISERTGRGVPTILNNYGEKAFEFSNNWIQVTIPFNFINAVDYQIEKKVVNKSGEEVVNK